MLLGPVFLNRYDPLPALLTSLALVALLRSRERTAGALLGVATGAEDLHRGGLLPVAVRRVRSLRGGGTVAFVAAAAVLTLPFFLLAPGGVGFSFWTQLRRHLQIESLGASILLVGSKLGDPPCRLDRGQARVDRPRRRVCPTRSACSSLLSLALVVLVLRAYWRGADNDAGSSPRRRPRSSRSPCSARCSRRST